MQIFLDTDLSEETAEVKPLKWEEDIQLFSRFLDRKVGVTILVRLYVPLSCGESVNDLRHMKETHSVSSAKFWLFDSQHLISNSPFCVQHISLIKLGLNIFAESQCTSVKTGFRTFRTDFYTSRVFSGGVGWRSRNLHEKASRAAGSPCRLSAILTASKTWWRHRLRLWVFWRVFYSRALCTFIRPLFSRSCATFLYALRTLRYLASCSPSSHPLQTISFSQYCTWYEKIIHIV